MFKSVVAAALMLLCLCSSAHAGPCEKWEYAKLKDATKKELSDQYCDNVAHVVANKAITQARWDWNADALERGDLESAKKSNAEATTATYDTASCMANVEDAEEMLQKKFKSKPPEKCRREYESVVNRFKDHIKKSS